MARQELLTLHGALVATATIFGCSSSGAIPLPELTGSPIVSPSTAALWGSTVTVTLPVTPNTRKVSVSSPLTSGSGLLPRSGPSASVNVVLKKQEGAVVGTFWVTDILLETAADADGWWAQSEYLSQSDGLYYVKQCPHFTMPSDPNVITHCDGATEGPTQIPVARGITVTNCLECKTYYLKVAQKQSMEYLNVAVLDSGMRSLSTAQCYDNYNAVRALGLTSAERYFIHVGKCGATAGVTSVQGYSIEMTDDPATTVEFHEVANPDLYEPDNSPSEAKELLLNQAQDRTFSVTADVGDDDWLSFVVP
jgi:hypothetical protein